MMKLVLSWFGLHSMQHAFTQFHALLLQFPRNLMKFMDIPTIYNFIQVFPILLTIAFLGIGLRLVWYLLWSSCLTSKTTNFYDGIPAVPGIPFIGIAHRLFTVNNKTDIHYEALRLVQEYGPLMQFDLFGKHFVMVNDGTLARQVLDEVRGKGSFQQSAFEPHQNVFSMDSNAAWRKRRNAFRHPFNPTSLKTFESKISELVDTLDQLLAKSAKAQEIVKIDELFGRFALDVIYNLGFDMQCDYLHDGKKYQELNEGIQLFFQNSWVMSIPYIRYLLPLHYLLPAYQKYTESRRMIRQFQLEIYDYILKKYMDETLSKNCFAFCLLEYALQENLDMEDVLSELFIMIIAGHETTAHTLSWLVYALTTVDGLQEKCSDVWKRASANSTTASSTSSKYVTVLPTYLEAVVKESMRRFPAVSRGSMRVVTSEEGCQLQTSHLQQQDIYVHGKVWNYPNHIHLQKDIWILVNVFALQNTKSNWGKYAEEFKPERWLDQATSPLLNSQAAYAGVGLHPKEVIFAPFSSGVRNCLGMNMALMEIRAVFPMLLQKYRFQLADEELRDVSKALITDITMKPLHQLPVYVTSRQ